MMKQSRDLQHKAWREDDFEANGPRMECIGNKEDEREKILKIEKKILQKENGGRGRHRSGRRMRCETATRPPASGMAGEGEETEDRIEA
jgi:hypothetical protein